MPGAAAGPIRPLTTDRMRITDCGIEYVERHLARLEADAAHSHMVDRLRGIA